MRTFMLTLGCLLLLTACDKEPELVTICKRQVERRLLAPSTARYGSIGDLATDSLGVASLLDKRGYLGDGGKTGVWFAYVDSQNAFGAPRRSYIFCSDTGSGLELDLADNLGGLSVLLDGW